MPTHKTDRDRGYYGVWLRRGRERLGWTQKETVTWLRDQGVPVDDNYYRQVEAGPGKRFGPEVHDALVSLFGSEPEPLPEPAPAGGNADIVAAIDRLTAAIEAQTRVMMQQPLQTAAAFIQLRDLPLEQVAALLGAAGELEREQDPPPTTPSLSGPETVRG